MSKFRDSKKVAEGMQAKIDDRLTGFPDRCDHEPPVDAIPVEASLESDAVMCRYKTEAAGRHRSYQWKIGLC